MATVISLPRTFVSASCVILLFLLVEQISAVKYSDYQLPGETGKYITRTSSEEEQLCHVCPNDLGVCRTPAVNQECRRKNQNETDPANLPWCYCGPVVGCEPLPVYTHGAYKCLPSGHWNGSVYQTCLPQCDTGFRLVQGNVLRCGEDRKWNGTMVPPICTNKTEFTALKTTKETAPPFVEIGTPPSPSVNVSVQPWLNGTEGQGEDSSWLNPVLLWPILGSITFVLSMSLLMYLCRKFNRGCHKFLWRKSPDPNFELLSIETSGEVPAAPSSPSGDDVILNVSDGDDGESTGVAIPLASISTTASRSTTASVHVSGSSDVSSHESDDSSDESDGDSHENDPLIPNSPSNSGDETPVKKVAEQESRATESQLDTESIIENQNTERLSHLRSGDGDGDPHNDIDLSSVEPLSLSDFKDTLESRHEPDGANSLDAEALRVEAQKEKPRDSEGMSTYGFGLPHTPLKRDQGNGGERTNVIRLTSPPPHLCAETYASPPVVRVAGNCYPNDGHQQAGGNQCEGSRAEEVQQFGACGFNRPDASDHHQRLDEIDEADCVTFSEFQNERDALDFFSRLDVILINDPCDASNWIGVSMWILSLCNIDNLVGKLQGLKVTLRSPPPGNAYFDYVIKNFFMVHGVKLGRVLYFYAKKHPHHQIVQEFKKFHPKCRYCEQFYRKS